MVGCTIGIVNLDMEPLEIMETLTHFENPNLEMNMA